MIELLLTRLTLRGPKSRAALTALALKRRFLGAVDFSILVLVLLASQTLQDCKCLFGLAQMHVRFEECGAQFQVGQTSGHRA